MRRVLFISPGYPAPGSGTGERSLSIFNAISRVAEPHILIVYRGGSLPPESGEVSCTTVRLLEPSGDSTWFWRRRSLLHRDYFIDRRIHGVVADLHKKFGFDAFVCRYFSSIICGSDKLGPTLLDFDDLPEKMHGPRLPGWHRVTWQLMLRRVRSFRTVFVTKSRDAARLAHPDVRLLPCISTRAPSRPEGASIADDHCMLFVGSVNWPPNRAGINHFIRNVLPEIRKAVPNAVLRMVGEGSQSISGEGVEGVGFVDDLEAEYARASLVVCPIFEGAGANIKLAEAVRFGKAVISTPHAASGFTGILEPERDLWIAGSDEVMSEMAVRLLTDASQRERLGRHARATAEVRLSQNSIDKTVIESLANCWTA